MPRKAKRPCCHRGCPSLVEVGAGGYCPAHTKQRSTERNQRIDANRGTSAQRGYDARWRRIRAMHLRRHPLCVDCLSEGHTMAAEEVDHIIPLAQGGTHRADNLQSLCKSHHSKKTATESLGWTKGGTGRGDQIARGLPPKTGPRSETRATAKLGGGG